MISFIFSRIAFSFTLHANNVVVFLELLLVLFEFIFSDGSGIYDVYGSIFLFISDSLSWISGHGSDTEPFLRLFLEHPDFFFGKGPGSASINRDRGIFLQFDSLSRISHRYGNVLLVLERGSFGGYHDGRGNIRSAPSKVDILVMRFQVPCTRELLVAFVAKVPDPEMDAIDVFFQMCFLGVGFGAVDAVEKVRLWVFFDDSVDPLAMLEELILVGEGQRA